MTERPRVKICGVTIAADALAVSACGADYLGLNMWPGSKRFVPMTHALTLAALGIDIANGGAKLSSD